MKIKYVLPFVVSALCIQVNAANYSVSNLIAGSGPSDTLFQSSGAINAPLLDGGIVALGYFPTNAYIPSGDIANIATTISDFTIVDFGLTGSFSAQLGAAGTAGYVDKATLDGSPIVGADPLIGRALYAFVGNSATLGGSSSFALKQVSTLADDTAAENDYTASPTGGVAPVIGQINTGGFTGNPVGFGSSTFNTLQLADPVPEPSTLLLSAFGVLGLLRRKR